MRERTAPGNGTGDLKEGAAGTEADGWRMASAWGHHDLLTKNHSDSSSNWGNSNNGMAEAFCGAQM